MKTFLLAVPYDSGHHRQRLGLGAQHLVTPVEEQLLANGHTVRKEEIIVNAAFPTEVSTTFEVNRKVAQRVAEAKKKGELPVVLAGNCNTAAIGTLSGLQDGSGVIWFDCHADFNTPETTLGGYLDGMALSIVAGHCWTQLAASVPGFKPVPQDRIVIAGTRDFDPLEADRLSHSGIILITPEMLKNQSYLLNESLAPMESVYLHIDLDVIDPVYVKANTYTTSGGISVSDLCRAVERIKNKCKISAIAFTAYDPALDTEEKMPPIVRSIVSII